MVVAERRFGMSNDTHGWCIGKDSVGAPTLSPCSVMRGVEGRYFAVSLDRDGNPITTRTYQRGEAFYESRHEALVEMVRRLDAVKLYHQSVLSYIAEQRYKAEQELEKENGDERR